MNKRLLLLLVAMILVSGYLWASHLSGQGKNFQDLHLGLFVHYMHPGKAYQWGETTWADGTSVRSLDELADNLDVADLAELAATMRAQYVIFTTWHANMNALYPSAIISQWLPGHTSKRDLIRDLIEALKKKGIELVLYVHPSDGHDFTAADQERSGWNDAPPYLRWNDFINAVLAEVTDRYGQDIAGFYIDGGLPPQVDGARLRKTITERKPDAWLIQNSGLDPNCADFGALERMQYPYPASAWLRCQTVTTEWWAMSASVTFAPELAYQYTVVQAAVKTRTGGGVAWSFGPHPGGRWETGIRSFCKRLGELVDRAGPSLLDTRPSTSFPIDAETPLVGLASVATESKDGTMTFLHILKPPKGNTLTLPVPSDGKRFSAARLLHGGEIKLTQNDAGIILTVDSPRIWDDVDTIVELR